MVIGYATSHDRMHGAFWLAPKLGYSPSAMDSSRPLRTLIRLSLWITVGLAAFAVVLLAYKPSTDFSLLYIWFFMPQFLVLGSSVLNHSSTSLTCGALWGCMALLGTLIGFVVASPDPEPWHGWATFSARLELSLGRLRHAYTRCGIHAGMGCYS